MASPKILPAHLPHKMYFDTTQKNLMEYWLANIVVFPTYLLCVLSAAQAFTLPIFLSFLIEPIRVVIWCIALFPVISVYFTPPHWHTGFANREGLVIASAVVAFFLLIDSDTNNVNSSRFIIFEISIFVWIFLGVLYRLSGTQRMLLATCLALVVPISIRFAEQAHLIYSFILFDLPYPAITLLLIFFPTLVAGTRLLRAVRRAFQKQNYGRSYLSIATIITIALLLVTVILGIWVLWQFSPQDLGSRAFLGLAALLIAATPSNFLGRQITHFRNLFARFRHAQLYDAASPVAHGITLANRIKYNWIPRYLTFDNRLLFFTFALVLGGIVIPFSISVSKPDTDPNVLLLIGISSSVIFVIIYLTFWFLRNRSRYVVTQFEVTGQTEEGGKSELNAVAQLTTHILVEELQQISTLLKLRQVERVNLAGDDSNAFFVTSGLDEEFIDQMQQIVNVDTSISSSVAVSRLLVGVTRLLARIRVRGWVQRRTNGSVEIWVELNYRNKNTVSVEASILPRYSMDEIDDKFIRPIARELALRLFVELGQVSHLGVSWKSLSEFLLGLDASSRRNWWEAIAHYRKALQMEETVRRSFGIGHYHLGAALVFQGNWDEGLEHLRTAESEGPPMAETQYMLALTFLYLYWGELHKDEKRFKEIEYHCRQAMTLRKHFPEAGQLRALAFYRRGKLQERTYTRIYTPPEDANRIVSRSFDRYRFDYEIAARYFWRTIREYNRILNNQRKNSKLFSLEEDHNSVLKQRMTAAHQFADSLRSLGRYSEAESYYDDVLHIYPRNLRTLTDLAKTYCLAQNWQYTQEFLWNQVFVDDIAAWDADVSIHMGWTLVGGTNEYLDRIAPRTIRFVASKMSKKYWEEVSEKHHQILGYGLQYLDFALHQRPRYLAVWRQTNWLEPFSSACSSLLSASKSSISEDYVELFFRPFQPKRPLIEHLGCWIALRIRMFGEPAYEQRFSAFNAYDHYAKGFLNRLTCKTDYAPFAAAYEKLLSCREKTATLTQRFQEERRVGGLYNTYERLRLAQELYGIWNDVRENFEKLWNNSTTIQPWFAERWVVDLYSEIALLTARMLSESAAYQLLQQVADMTSKDLDRWIMRWQEKYTYKNSTGLDKQYYTFSPRVLRYQRATLYAWKAFSAYQTMHNFLGRAYKQATSSGEDNTHEKYEFADKVKQLDDIQADIDESRSDIRYHPLAMFIQAQIYRERELYSQAVEEFERLLDLISPYDPKQNFGGTEFADNTPEPTSDKRRESLYYMEKISGRQQFNDIVSETNVYRELANTYAEMKQQHLTIRHLMEAVRSSPYYDLDVDNFLRLANQLNNQERYQEAQAVIDAMRFPSQKLLHLQLSDTKRNAPGIVECVITTRRNQFAKAMENAKAIAHKYTIRTNESYINALEEEEELRRYFDEALDCLDSIPQNDQRVRKRLEEALRVIDLRRKAISIEYPLTDLIFQAIKKQVGSNAFKFPQIFEYSQSNGYIELLEVMARRARYALCADEMAELLTHSRANYTDSSADLLVGEFFHIMQAHIFLFLAKQGRNVILQIAEICNVLAYSRAEIGGLDLDFAVTDSLTATAIMTYVTSYTDRANSSYLYHREKQAQFCDTLGWVYFRYAMRPMDATRESVPNPTDSLNEKSRSELQGQISKVWEQLKRAEDVLREGIRYSQQRAIIHYHLARLYLTRIEIIWQANPKDILETDIGLKGQSLDLYLSEAFNHWRNASQSDTFGRLHTQLVTLYSELNLLREAWEKREIKAIAGHLPKENENE